MTYMYKALICKQYYRKRFHFLCSTDYRYVLTLPAVIRTSHEIPPFMYSPVPRRVSELRSAGRGPAFGGPRQIEGSWSRSEERSYMSVCTNQPSPSGFDKP